MVLFFKWIILSLLITFVGWIIPGITITNFLTAMLASVVLALANIFVKPILVALTLPINVLTLGIFILFINGLVFWLVAKVVPGIEINSFWSAFFAAILLSVLSLGISWI